MIAVLDLFAGAGGLSLGFKKAGLTLAGAIEADHFAAETYRRNMDSAIYEYRVEDLSNRWFRRHFSGVDVVAGGPPCQGFSVAGPSQYRRVDERNTLILELGRVVTALKPQIAVLENVKGLLNGKLPEKGSALTAYLSLLSDAGYRSELLRLQAASFGVPQNRERIFVVSTKIRSLQLRLRNVRQWRTVADALSDLPHLDSGEGEDGFIPYNRPASSALQRVLRRSSPGLANHVAARHSPRILARFRAMRAGFSMRNVPAAHGQRRRNTHDIGNNRPFKMNYTRLHWERPALSVPANFQTIHVHPDQDRTLTAREGARLQGFPDWFRFFGPRTLPSRKLLAREGRVDEIGLSQFNQIGNAIPPPLSEALAVAILEAL